MRLNLKDGYFAWRCLAGALGMRRPLLGGIKLTHECNLACLHCPFRKRKGSSLTFERAAESMKTLRRWGVKIVILEGGEPFLWRDGGRALADVVKEARKLFFSVGVVTNGTFPIEADADVVWVSVDGMKESHNRIRGNCFDRVIANIEESSHPNILAHITINSLNWKDVPQLVRFLARRVKGITVQFHYPYDEAEDNLVLPPEKRKAVLAEIIALKREGLPVANSRSCLAGLMSNRWKCRPWMIASVNPDGALTRGCYVKGRGAVRCDRCGFSAHTEMSLAFGGVPDAILAGKRIFG